MNECNNSIMIILKILPKEIATKKIDKTLLMKDYFDHDFAF